LAPETLRGKLVVQAPKKGAARVLVCFPTRRGPSAPTPIRNGEWHPDLDAERVRDPRGLDGREVELELDGGLPSRVRPVGATWTAPAAPSGRPPGQGARGAPFQPAPPQTARTDGARGEFHNPYNFIPAPPRPTDAADLGDAEPIGHDRYHEGRWSGRLEVRLTTVTPLLIPDASRGREHDGHKTVPVRVDGEGRPYLPPTSVKGMLRAAFEAATNSRLGVFNGHDVPLAFRMEANEGLGLVPARIVDGARGDLEVELLPGTDAIAAGGRPAVLYAAWLPRYDHGQRARWAVTYASGGLPQHGDEVVAWVELFQHKHWDKRQRQHVADFRYWRVRDIAPAGTALASPPPSTRRDPIDGRSHHEPVGRPLQQVHGWVCVTNANINRKHDERVFFVDPAATPVPHRYPLSADLQVGWRNLIANYQAAHDEAEVWQRSGRNGPARPEDYLGDEPGQTAWSRQIYLDGGARRDNHAPQPDARDLAAGSLCYARVVDSGGGSRRVVALFPVCISRELHPLAPSSLLDASLQPAVRRDALSPADRVFGWVNPDGHGAYRGQLRVGPVRCVSEDAIEPFADPGLPLNILGQPKPQQARFYVAQDRDGRALLPGAAKPTAFAPGKGLRGRKCYPHDPGVTGSTAAAYWDPAPAGADDPTQIAVNGRFREYLRPLGRRGTRDNQNKSTLGWVRIGTTFTFALDVINLSLVELGALLWTLRPDDGFFHRLGGGKPLGFGSVQMDVTGTELRDGRGWCDYYLTLGDAPAAADFDDLRARAVEAFKAAVGSAYGRAGGFHDVAFVRAFLASGHGFDDGLPVHYPRTKTEGDSGPVPPNPEGESFEWFVENERGGRGLSLPDLAADRGLPYHVARESGRGGRPLDARLSRPRDTGPRHGQNRPGGGR
jgi:CRISPR-associated protein (TIGR03986 family)